MPPPDPPSASDSELLDGLRRGRHDAFDALFRAQYASLVGFAEAILRERALAEDVVQEVMLELWRRRETLSADTPLRPYLFRATRNRALNQIRHQRVVGRVEPDIPLPPADRADHAIMESELDGAIKAGIQALPDRCREVFELSRTQGLKYAEIAQVLGISIKTVEAQMGKAIRVLRERLGPWLDKE